MTHWEPGTALPPQFLEIAKHVYRDDPHWIPEDAAGVEFLWRPDNPYFRKSKARIWLTDHSRMAGFFDPLVEIRGEPVAYFGFWETTENAETCRSMFAEFETWARSSGATRVYGPINFNTYGLYRIRSDGQGPCFLGEPYNPKYYPALLKKCGYRAEVKYLSQVLTRKDIDTMWKSKSGALETLKKFPFEIRALTKEFWLHHLEQFYFLVGSIFSENFAYSPISPDHFAAAYGETFARRFCPDSSLVAVTPKGNVVGFCIGFPDYAPLCAQGAPSRIAVGDLEYEAHARLLTDPTLLVKTAGVHPDYRNTGLLTAMALKILDKGRALYPAAIMCLIKEGNYSAEFCKKFASSHRSYALYSKAL